MNEEEILAIIHKQARKSFLISSTTGAVTAILGVLLLVWVPGSVGGILGGILIFSGAMGFGKGILGWANQEQATVDLGQVAGRYSQLTIMLWFLSVGLFFRAYSDVYRSDLGVWTIAWVALGAVVWVASMIASKRAIKWF